MIELVEKGGEGDIFFLTNNRPAQLSPLTVCPGMHLALWEQLSGIRVCFLWSWSGYIISLQRPWLYITSAAPWLLTVKIKAWARASFYQIGKSLLGRGAHGSFMTCSCSSEKATVSSRLSINRQERLYTAYIHLVSSFHQESHFLTCLLLLLTRSSMDFDRKGCVPMTVDPWLQYFRYNHSLFVTRNTTNLFKHLSVKSS